MSYLEYAPQIERELMQSLSQKNGLRSSVYLFALFCAFAVIFWGAIYFANPLVYVMAFLLVGILQHHLLIVQHEALHLFLFNSRRANDWVGAVVSFLIGFTMRYRKHHFRHHRNLGEAVDPDLHNYTVKPLTPRHLWKMLLLNLSGVAAITQFFQQSVVETKVVSDRDSAESRDWGVIGIIVTQLLLLSLFAYLGRVELYFLLWLLPLVTLTKTITNLRNMAEHVIIDGETRFRTILCGPIEQFVFAPLNFNFHAEHHLCLSVPYQNLPLLHTHLVCEPGYEQNVDVQKGYIATLRNAMA